MEEKTPPYINLDCDELSIDYIMPWKWLEKLLKFEFTPYINDTNTPYWETIISDLEFNYILTNPKNYNCWFKFQTIINNKIIPCFQINVWKIQWWVEVNNTIVIYSSFIQVFWKEFILDFLNENFETKYFIDMPSRFDICLDIPESKTNILDSITIPFTSTIWFDRLKWSYETYYFLKKSTNYSVFIRIYDKIKDTFKNEKPQFMTFEITKMLRE